MEKDITLETSSPPPSPPSSTSPSLPWLSRFLALWIILAMAIGMLLGAFIPSAAPALQKHSSSFGNVSIPLLIGLLVMMYPLLCGVPFTALRDLVNKEQKLRAGPMPKREEKGVLAQLAFSVVVNWVVAPLGMTGLAWAMLPDRGDLRSGLVVVGLGRCIAMVLVWTALSDGDTTYCALLVALNSLLQLILFAPLSAGLLRLADPSAKDIAIPSYSLVARSVGIFLGIPLAAALVTQSLFHLFRRPHLYPRFVAAISPVALLGLLYTVIVLFAMQGARVVSQIASVARVAAPLVAYFLVLYVSVLWAARRILRCGYRLAVVQALTAASNNFELAIAVAVAVYGADSGQALAATVGPLVEVPVLVGLVYLSRWLRKKLVWKEDEAKEVAV